MKRILFLSFLLLINACSTKINSAKKEEEPTPTPTPTPVEPTPVMPSLDQPYKLNVIAHGGPSGGVPQYSSATALDLTGDQAYFVTDSTIQIRLKARANPGKVAKDSHGVECKYLPLTYTKLKVRVGVRARNASTYIETSWYENIPVDSFSAIQYFPVPANSATEPFVIELMDTHWDYSCAKNGSYCPYERVWEKDCFELEIHLATDHTKGLDDSSGI